MKTSATHGAIEAVWRIESARLIAGLTRMVSDVGLAEDLAQDSLVAALEHWPESGVPDKPGAWLMPTAKRRALDLLRRGKVLERKYEELGRDMEAQLEPDFAAVASDEIGDDVLRLVFMACHPILSAEARVALTLRLLGGLTTGEIARAFLVPEATVAQRIVRAKRTLAAARVPFEVPGAAELTSRLSSVLRSSTSCSTRATRRPPVMTGSDPRSVRRRSASVVPWRSSLRRNRRSTVSSRSWRFKPHA